MKLLSPLLFVVFFAFGCGNPEAPTKPKKEKKLAPKAEKQAKPKREPLVTETAIPFLKKFAKENPEDRVKLVTSKGDIVIQLYKDTPLHRANFVALAKNKVIDGALFYRVMDDFMIQGGNSDDDDFLDGRRAWGSYDIPPEFHDKYFHKRGALAMARDYSDNPEKTSSTYSFYIVQGMAQSKGLLRGLEVEKEIDIAEWKKLAYLKYGGQPGLDGEHTVFGEVIRGMDVVDSIAAVRVDRGDWPIENISFTLEVLKD